MQLSHLIKLIYKYRLIFFIICSLTVLTAVIFTSFQKPEYKVSTQWLLEKMEFKKAPQSKKRGKNVSVNLTKFSRGNTFLEAEVLNSFPIISQLHKLSKIPYSLRTFKTNIVIYGDYKPYITIRFYSNSLDEINRVLDISKSLFMEKLISSRIEYHLKNIQFLESLTADAKENNSKIKHQLKNTEVKYNTLDPISSGIAIQDNLKHYQNIINEIKQEIRSQEESYKSFLTKLKAKNINEVISRASLSTNVYILDTIKNINNEKINNINLKAKYTEKHKTVIESNNHLENLNKELLKYYQATLGKHITKHQLKTLIPYTPIQLNMAKNAIDAHINIEANKNKLKIFEKAYEKEKGKIAQASKTKAELGYLEAVSDFNEVKLNLTLNLLLKETLNLGLAKHNYIQTTIKEPFIKQTKPNYPANIFYAVGLGLLLSIFTVLLIETLNPYIQNTDFIEAYDIPIMGNLSNTKDLIYSFHQDNESIKEYTSLKLLFSYIKNTSKNNIFTILPSTEDNSNSIALTNLSITLARSGEKVLLIDLDFDTPQIDKLFEISNKTVTINTYFETKTVSPDELLTRSNEFEKLDIILAQRPKYLLKETIYYSNSLKDLIKNFSKQYDYVFINLSKIESLPYLDLIDHSCLLVKLNRTTFTQFTSIINYLKDNNIQLDSCIIDTSENTVK